MDDFLKAIHVQQSYSNGFRRILININEPLTHKTEFYLTEYLRSLIITSLRGDNLFKVRISIEVRLNDKPRLEQILENLSHKYSKFLEDNQSFCMKILN